MRASAQCGQTVVTGRLLAKNLLDYTMLMTLYGTGMRRAELIHLKCETSIAGA
jgi:site-specific recombinase XerD